MYPLFTNYSDSENSGILKFKIYTRTIVPYQVCFSHLLPRTVQESWNHDSKRWEGSHVICVLASGPGWPVG